MGMLDLATSYGASVARLGLGLNATPPAKYPKKTLELYEFEACPFCRKVREALTELDLEAMIYPCPKGGKLYRPAVEDMGGKAKFPYLIDPNTNVSMYESDAIIDYLYETYGERSPSVLLKLGPITFVSAQLASLLRPLQGSRSRASRERIANRRLRSDRTCDREKALLALRLHDAGQPRAERAAEDGRNPGRKIGGDEVHTAEVV